MTTVDRIKQICNERRIPISRLEKACGFANGYIGQLKKGSLPDDRLVKIADYLGVTPEYIQTGTEPGEYYISSETAKIAQWIFNNRDMRLLFESAQGNSPENLRLAAELLERMTVHSTPIRLVKNSGLRSCTHYTTYTMMIGAKPIFKASNTMRIQKRPAV